MRSFVRRSLDHLSRTLPWTLLTAVAVLARAVWPPRGFDATGVVALRDLALTLVLWFITSVLAYRLGDRLLRLAHPPDLTRLEHAVFALALGLCGLGYVAFALGMTGLLSAAWIAGALLGLCLWVGPEVRPGLAAVRQSLSRCGEVWGSAEPLAKIAAVLAAAIGALAFVHALSPPWDYDGLMYHLVGPQLFLREGRIIPYPDNWYVNAPFVLEMVFSVGMAFGDDVFPKLVHLTTGLLLILATYAAGRRWLGGRGGWLSAAILLGVPTLPIWAAFAYIDLGWSLFEFLALMAGVAWWQSRSRPWLRLCGVFIGLAMASKYLGLMGFAVLGIFVAVMAPRERVRGWLSSVGGFGVIAMLVASPWYLKNLVWFGNPVFPLYLGGPQWPPERLALYSAYLDSFGTGRGLLDYLLIPLNVYARHALYGTMMNRIDVPAFLFLILIAYPFRRKNSVVSLVLGLCVARVILWSVGSQQLRFLMPVYPALSAATAYVSLHLIPSTRSRLPWHQFLTMLAVGMMALTLFYQLVVITRFRPTSVAFGLESRGGFLTRIVKDFGATRFATESLPAGSRVLALGDGRGYYCPERCLPDPDHFRWSSEIAALESEQDLADWFDQRGITHVLLSLEDLDFLLQHDPAGVVRSALDRILLWRDLGCLEEAYRDEWASVYAVACD
jgi:4-amino-4-deoxy-L-arabinose transferase-like glycosyltransferase